MATPYLYNYVGPAALAETSKLGSFRSHITSQSDVLHWLDSTSQTPDDGGSITATFVVDGEGRLWIADRHSEHVACARGGPVRSAGEMAFVVFAEVVEVVDVTNQSTGYCPRPESWDAVACALDTAAIEHPGDFSIRLIFRRCACGQINIVKDDVYECDLCGGALPLEWNCDSD